MKKIIDFNPDILWLIDNLIIGQTKDKIRCVFKYNIDGYFVVALLRDERDGDYFITSQKEPYLNGMILELSDKQQEKIEALHWIIRTYREIEDKVQRLTEYEQDLSEKYLKVEFDQSKFNDDVIAYCQSLIIQQNEA